MQTAVHPIEVNNNNFLKWVFSAMESTKNAGLKPDGANCIAVYKSEDDSTYGWTLKESKNTRLGSPIVTTDGTFRVMAIVTAKY